VIRRILHLHNPHMMVPLSLCVTALATLVLSSPWNTTPWVESLGFGFQVGGLLWAGIAAIQVILTPEKS
jgi:hypothetical protein